MCSCLQFSGRKFTKVLPVMARVYPNEDDSKFLHIEQKIQKRTYMIPITVCKVAIVAVAAAVASKKQIVEPQNSYVQLEIAINVF